MVSIAYVNCFGRWKVLTDVTARSFEIFSTFTAVIDILTSELMEEKKKKEKKSLPTKLKNLSDKEVLY